MSPSPIVYFAHPVDFTGRDYAKSLYDLRNAGLTTYVPAQAFKVPAEAEVNAKLGRINRAALDECDGLVAFLPQLGETSFGVPMEIEQARGGNKPTLIVGDPDVWTRSWALPRTELVVFTDELTSAALRMLSALIARENRNRNRPPASRAMYVQLDPGAVLPTRAYDGDAGFDLYALNEVTIMPGEFVDVPMGCRVQLPDDAWAMITGRSSTVRKLDLLVTVGIIDSGYRGPLFAGVRSLRDSPYTVKKGERLAQLIPFPNLAQRMHATPVDALGPSDRGEAGFGSSGA